MSKSFSHSSFSRDLNRDMPSHHRRDTSGMGLLSTNQSLNLHSGLGRMNQGSGRLSSLMNMDSMSKLSHQGSHGMLSSSSSTQNLPSIFSLGNRPGPPLSSQPRGESDQANKLMASFGLSSRDLDELSRYPDDKITAESLPQLIQHIKRRRTEEMSLLNFRENRSSREPLRMSNDDWDNSRPFRRDNFNDRPSGLDPVVDYDHGSRTRDSTYRDRLDFDDRARDRERFRDDSFLPDNSYRKFDNEFEPMNYGQSQERSVFDKPRRMPTNRNIDDFHGLLPKDFPHLCSLCDIPILSKQNWNEHTNGRTHKKQRLLLLELYPEWNGHGQRDSYMLHQSTNPAPGILGPPPPAFNMGNEPEGRRGNHRGHLGNEEMPGPRHIQKRPGIGRVVHIMDFERGKNLKYELLKFAEPFGVIANHLILNKMNEAFIEMSTPEEAMAVVDYYSTNPAYIFGNPVRVHLSQKYKRIKKPDLRPQQKPEPRQDLGRVIHLSNVPHAGFTDAAILKVAEAYGKVKNYILMRMKKQAFIEMDRAEDAQAMVDHCASNALVFQGKTLKVDLSERYKKLILRIPNKAIEQTQHKEKTSRKRAHSPDRKDGNREKQLKTDKPESGDGDDKSTSAHVTTEDVDQVTEEIDQKDIVTDSCEPELVEEEEEEEDETAALLETSSSVGDDAEMADACDGEPDVKEEDASEAQIPITSTPAAKGTDEKKAAHRYPGNIDDFVTLDEVGDEDDAEGHKLKSSAGKSTKPDCSSFMTSTCAEEGEPENEAVTQAQPAGKDATSENAESQLTTDSESAAETSVTGASMTELSNEYALGPYEPNNPVGVDYVVPKTGFYCKLCSLFYTSEDVAKVTHCSSLPHYQKLKKLLNKMSKSSEKKN